MNRWGGVGGFLLVQHMEVRFIDDFLGDPVEFFFFIGPKLLAGKFGEIAKVEEAGDLFGQLSAEDGMLLNLGKEFLGGSFGSGHIEGIFNEDPDREGDLTGKFLGWEVGAIFKGFAQAVARDLVGRGRRGRLPFPAEQVKEGGGEGEKEEQAEAKKEPVLGPETLNFARGLDRPDEPVGGKGGLGHLVGCLNSEILVPSNHKRFPLRSKRARKLEM